MKINPSFEFYFLALIYGLGIWSLHFGLLRHEINPLKVSPISAF